MENKSVYALQEQEWVFKGKKKVNSNLTPLNVYSAFKDRYKNNQPIRYIFNYLKRLKNLMRHIPLKDNYHKTIVLLLATKRQAT